MNTLAHDQAPALSGEAVYFFAFDVGYEMRRTPVTSLLGCSMEPLHLDPRKRAPHGQIFYRPLAARLPDVTQSICGQSVTLRTVMKVLPIGALSITVRLAFETENLAGLQHWHALVFDDGSSLHHWILELAEKARAELAPHTIRPHARLPEGESYTVFCIHSASTAIDCDAAEWLEKNRASVAALLTREKSAPALSDQEISESTARWLSYYRHDLVVSDWDAALVIDEPSSFDETLYVLELANVQLEELEAYDTFVDEALERAYRDIRGPRHARRGGVIRELQEVRIDLARFSDELSNITKFFGEWHLARVYENAARVFHLSDWHRAIDEKLKTLDSLYEMLKADQNHRVMLWLETAIVILFIIDVVNLFTGHK